MLVTELLRAADEDNVEVLKAVKSGKNWKDIPNTHPRRVYSKVWDELSVKMRGNRGLLMVGARIVIPRKARGLILYSYSISWFVTLVD